MSHYETCSICGNPFEPYSVCSDCLDAIEDKEKDALRARVAEMESVRDDHSRAYAVQGLALEEERTRVAELEAGIFTAMQLIEGGFDSAAYEALEALNAHK